MFKLFEHLFITKKYPDKMDDNKRVAYGLLSSTIGIICNVFLCILKLIVGIIFASISIITDGLNNLSDSASSIVGLIGFKLSKKSPDENHPYGHERIEYISALFVSCSIIVLSIILAKTSIEKIINHSNMDLSKFYLVVILLVVSILVKMWMMFVYRYVYKRIDSLTSKASSQDSLNDVIATSIILVSLIIAYYTNIALDAYLALGLALYMLVGGIKLAIETISVLIGEATSKEDIKTIEKEILSYDNILGVHDLFIHKYGPNKTFASIHCEMDASMNMVDCHNIVDAIERDFKTKHNISLTIHIDPVEKEDSDTIFYKNIITTIVTKYEYKFHDFRIVKGTNYIKILFDLVIPYKMNNESEQIVKSIKEEFMKEIDSKDDINYQLIIDVDNDE